jgi:hypothetical protein
MDIFLSLLILVPSLILTAIGVDAALELDR